jgi:putative ABC transport system permease protein
VAEALRTGWIEIASHKVRSALTCVAISFGVAAMVYTFSQVAGMNKRMKKAFELMGPGRLFISAKWDSYVSKGLSRGLTWQDAEAMRRLMPEFAMVSPFVSRGGVRLRLGKFKNDDIEVMAVTPEFRRREWVYGLRGRFLNEYDMDRAERVCVLLQPGGWFQKQWWASRISEHPFAKYVKHHDLLGQRIRLDDHLFTVVGVLASPLRDQDPRWFGFWNRFAGNIVFVPLNTYRQCLAQGGGPGGADRVDQIHIDTGDEATVGLAKRRLEALLKNLHRGEPDFELKDLREILQGAISDIRSYAMAVAVIGLIAILAGGIGIMNVTLATIFSRIREIGIRRALGATRTDIVAQFLVEATMLGCLGGVVGAGLGIAAVTYLSPRSDRMAEISALHVIGAMALAAVTSFFFALYPAYQAAKLDPIESLHYE